MSQEVFQYSKYLSLILRHMPDKAGITLDANGWTDVKELLFKTKTRMEFLERVVATNDKKRFEFNDDKTKIRACQGHSVDIDLKLTPAEPTETLYHGTANRNKALIEGNGLDKMNRQYVHLSRDVETALKVGQRHCGMKDTIVFRVAALQMHKDGFKFFLSANGVWLTERVPAQYLSIWSKAEITPMVLEPFTGLF